MLSIIFHHQIIEIGQKLPKILREATHSHTINESWRHSQAGLQNNQISWNTRQTESSKQCFPWCCQHQIITIHKIVYNLEPILGSLHIIQFNVSLNICFRFGWYFPPHIWKKQHNPSDIIRVYKWQGMYQISK